MSSSLFRAFFAGDSTLTSSHERLVFVTSVPKSELWLRPAPFPFLLAGFVGRETLSLSSSFASSCISAPSDSLSFDFFELFDFFDFLGADLNGWLLETAHSISMILKPSRVSRADIRMSVVPTVLSA
jgi:hypothetical protein